MLLNEKQINLKKIINKSFFVVRDINKMIFHRKWDEMGWDWCFILDATSTNLCHSYQNINCSNYVCRDLIKLAKWSDVLLDNKVTK